MNARIEVFDQVRQSDVVSAFVKLIAELANDVATRLVSIAREIPLDVELNNEIENGLLDVLFNLRFMLNCRKLQMQKL